MILYIIIIFFNTEYPVNKKHEPSSKGIEIYIEENAARLIQEFQKIVNDSLYDVYVYSGDLSLLPDYDSLSLGSFFIPNEIIITTQEKFVAYELKDISKYEKNTYIKANNFVKGTVYHELMHYYFNQVIREMQINQQPVSIEYNNFSMIPRINTLGEKLIEEGICEYVAVKNKESIFPKYYYTPKTLADINNKKYRSELLYEYSVEYVRLFIDYYGYKKAIQLLVSVKPPTNEEILFPVIFYKQFNSQ
jgi:hypothetical protein